MEITARSLWTLIHGMGFGALYLLACSGVLVELIRRYSPNAECPISPRDEIFLKVYLIVMAVLAWITVLTGTYIIYPWYRAVAQVGTVNLAGFPQMLLKSSPDTIGWHSLGMEWKEHVAWLVPISITMAAVVFVRYGRNLRSQPQLRAAVLCFTLTSFLAAGIAGFFGAMLVKNAPVEGGQVIHLMHGE
ncbi:MAG: hypothetical protein ABSD72_17335 [Terracidiphilus sp.]|jgi:hypothetical protein